MGVVKLIRERGYIIYIYYLPYVRKSGKEVEREKTIRRHISRIKTDELNERARENCERKRL